MSGITQIAQDLSDGASQARTGARAHSSDSASSVAKISQVVHEAFGSGNPDGLKAQSIMKKLAAQAQMDGAFMGNDSCGTVQVILDSGTKVHLANAPIGDPCAEDLERTFKDSDLTRHIFSSSAQTMQPELKQKLLSNGWELSDEGKLLYRDWVQPIQLEDDFT